MSIKAAYLDCARSAVALLGAPEVGTRWEEPSALEHYTVGGLAGHLAGQILVVRTVLEAGPVNAPTISIHEYLAQARWLDAPHDGEVHTGIRTKGEDEALDGAAALSKRAAEALGWLRDRLTDEPEERVVQFPWGPPALTLGDLLVNRLLELVVHLDDLAVSAGLPTPPLPNVEPVIDALSRLAVRRHGALAVIRALSRAERAPATIAAF